MTYEDATPLPYFRLYLPSEEELKAELDRERAMLLQSRDDDTT
jgi:hypothetical protein